MTLVKIQRSVIVLLLMFVCLSGFAQTGRVLTRNSESQEAVGIQVKWYSQSLIYPSGVNIYRREKEKKGWKKLNQAPIVRKNDLPEDAYRRDENLDVFTSLVNESSPSNLEGFVLLNVMIKSFESEIFSDFLGISFMDSQITQGAHYQYKVSKIVGKGEELVGISDFIKAGNYEEDAPLQNLSAKVNKLSVELSWKPEDNRFYGVNIYRTSSTEMEAVKVNDQPVMISQTSEGEEQAKAPEYMYLDDSLQENVSYTYFIRGVNFFGKESQRSSSVTLPIQDVTPPPPPRNLQESIDNPNVMLVWENPISVDFHETIIYRSKKSDGPFERINREKLPNSENSYIDDTPKNGGYYYYAASADTLGNEAASRVVFAEINDITPPSKPQGLTVEADTGKIYLKWQMNPEIDLMGYLIYRTVDKGDKDQFVLLNADPIKADNHIELLPLNAKNRFLYKIVAIDSAYNRSDPSEIAGVRMPDVLPPAKPFIKSSFEENENIVIEWNPNVDDDLRGYNIYRTMGSDTAVYEQLNINLLSPGVYRYTDRSAEPGEDYFYTLQAIDSSGNYSARSNIYNVKKTSPVETASFTKVKAQYNKKKKEVAISWKIDSSSDLLGFVIFKKSGEENSMSPLTGLLNAVELVDKDILLGKSYSYEIRAFGQTGAITKSDLLTVDVLE